MKKWICALIALMMVSCMAFAEEAAPVIEAVDISTVSEENTAEAPAEETETEEVEEAVIPEEEAAGTITVGFEDGFVLELPEGWLHYDLTDAMAEKGVMYCLSDASAERWLYIQRWNSDCEDIDALSSLINEISQPQTSGVYNFNGTDFIVYDLAEGDVSCCAAMMDDYVLNMVFTPQSDPDFMVTAAQIIGSFTVL